MKKITLILLIAIQALFFTNEVAAQCENCLIPKVCTDFTLTVPNCGTIKYTICYQCLTNPPGLHADILEMEGLTCTDYADLDAVWDSAYAWIRENSTQLCGFTPCNVDEREVTITRPMCASIYYLASQQGQYKVKFDNACDKRCTKKYEICWCDCIYNQPGHCWVDDCMTLGPGYRYTLIDSYITGNGTCEEDWTMGDLNSLEDWILNCVLYDSHCE